MSTQVALASRVANMLPELHHVVVCGTYAAWPPSISLAEVCVCASRSAVSKTERKKVSVHSAPIAARWDEMGLVGIFVPYLIRLLVPAAA